MTILFSDPFRNILRRRATAACQLANSATARAVLQQRLQDIRAGRRDAIYRLELAIPQKSLHIFGGPLLHLRFLGIKRLLPNLGIALAGEYQIQCVVAA